jgi:hypothetical protein
MLRIITLSLVVLLATAGQASEYWEQQLFAELEEASITEHKKFAFVQRVDGEDGAEISAFEPTGDPQWTLLSLNGETPTKKDIKKYNKEKVKEAKRNEGNGFRDLITKGSVVLKEETIDEVIVTFTPDLDDMSEKAMESMRGEATFRADDGTLSSLTIYSIEPFSPALSVKLEEMNMSFEFEEVMGETLPKRYLFSFRGKVAGLKSFDVDSVVAYSDYQKK